MNDSLNDLVYILRETGSDFTSVEAKSAAGGFPESLTESLSALANLPGGGVIILGLDEETGFTPVALVNIPAMKAALGQKVRNFTPPVHLDIEDGEVDGKPVIVARVHECAAAHKPCRAPDGKAYVRSWDGDYVASELEEQAFLMQRTHPRADSNPVPTATADELDPELIALWREVRGGRRSVRTRSFRRRRAASAGQHPYC